MTFPPMTILYWLVDDDQYPYMYIFTDTSVCNMLFCGECSTVFQLGPDPGLFQYHPYWEWKALGSQSFIPWGAGFLYYMAKSIFFFSTISLYLQWHISPRGESRKRLRWRPNRIIFRLPRVNSEQFGAF